MSRGRDSTATWGRDLSITFCDLCVKEVELGNRPTTHFNKDGWDNIMKGFKARTGKNYNKNQLKNRWDNFKKDWKLWKELKRGATGLGWDSVRQTVDASDEWWAEKLLVHPNCKKFRTAGIDPEMEDMLDRMFSGAVATGLHTWTPSSVPPIVSEEVVGERMSNDDVEEFFNDVAVEEERQRATPSTAQTQATRKRQRSTNQLLADGMTTLVTSYSSIAAAKGKQTVESCCAAIHQLGTIPEVVNDRRTYMKATSVLEDKVKRTFFLEMPPEYRLDFLQYHIDKLD